MTEIIQADYQVRYDPVAAAVTCQGSFRLQGDEYKPVLDVLLAAADAKPPLLTLDVCALQFLNSSGINTLSKFVLHVRKLGASQVLIRGSSRFPWQEKSLINMQRLLPALKLEIA